MISKQQIESFLKANGIPPTAKDEEIRSMLLSARWNNNEVDTALMVLKENRQSKKTHIDTLHKVFQSDERLSPTEISTLLGIDVPLTAADTGSLSEKRFEIQKMQVRIGLILSLVIALLSVVYVMYHEKAGLFHPSVSIFDER